MPDKNLASRLAGAIADSERDTCTVKDEGMSEQQDEAIYRAYVAGRRVLDATDLHSANSINPSSVGTLSRRRLVVKP